MRKRALISVTDKTGIVEFAKRLVAMGWEIVSTGGTAKALIAGGVPCIQVADITHYPEMMDGRVRTLHPAIFGGIIADRNIPKHLEEAAEFKIDMIGMVVVNMYNFAAKPCVNEIDVGGPSMLRAAAKNFSHVIVVVDPDDYDTIAFNLETKGDLALIQRQTLAEKVFEATTTYDEDIRDHFHKANAEKRIVELGKHGG